MPAAEQLKLIALDADDLAVISAHVQDARVQASDIVWRQDEKRLVVGLNRLDWEQTLSGGTAPRRSQSSRFSPTTRRFSSCRHTMSEACTRASCTWAEITARSSASSAINLSCSGADIRSESSSLRVS